MFAAITHLEKSKDFLLKGAIYGLPIRKGGIHSLNVLSPLRVAPHTISSMITKKNVCNGSVSYASMLPDAHDTGKITQAVRQFLDCADVSDYKECLGDMLVSYFEQNLTKKHEVDTLCLYIALNKLLDALGEAKTNQTTFKKL